MALTLHMHPLSSYCWKVLIALYENATPFEPRVVNIGDPQERAAFAALWPTSKIPLLQDAARGRVVPETSIMIEYLDRHYPGDEPLIPADEDARLDARLWDRIFDCYVMTPMQAIVGDRLRPETERDPRGVANSRSTLRMAYELIDRQFQDRQWAAGSFSIADCAAAPALFYASIVEPFASDQIALTGYFERLLARPSVARAIVQAQPYFRYFPYREAMPARFFAGGAT
jgi:glutathione S-transferase